MCKVYLVYKSAQYCCCAFFSGACYAFPILSHALSFSVSSHAFKSAFCYYTIIQHLHITPLLWVTSLGMHITVQCIKSIRNQCAVRCITLLSGRIGA